ncbi:conodipine-P3-like isoform X1 [Oculina patagonica]
MRVTTFLVFISMLLMLLLHLEEVKARSGCFRNGCNTGLFSLSFSYRLLFTPAIKKHDVCLACGVRNGWSRLKCDKAFYRDMISLCRRFGWVNKAICYKTAHDTFSSVRVAGWVCYKKPSLWWCPHCPKKYGDPNGSLFGR